MVSLVLTVMGPDRPGLIESLAQSVANHDGNWLESRMAKMSGQFAGILRVRVPQNQAAGLTDELRSLSPEGLHVVVASTDADSASDGSRNLHLELVGSDRPGIIREISRALASRGINVDELSTSIESAPMSGEMLFHATADLRGPPGLDLDELRASLESLASELMVDVSLDSP
jgi:glycine cleavage system regulatory protein